MSRMKSYLMDIVDLCNSHRATVYFADTDGLVGVYNHRNVIFWYRYTLAGFSLTGETSTPQGADMHKLDTDK